MNIEEKYVIDASSLIDLNKFNPIDLYPSPWNKIERLINNGMLFSSIEVYKELVKKDDVLSEWIKNHKQMFKPVTKKQTEIISQILKKYPSIINVKKENVADPWVIALAVELSEAKKQKTLLKIKWLVVTEERKRGNRIRIPLICEDYNIDYLKIFDMFRRKGWKF
jgi:hypothetical protein